MVRYLVSERGGLFRTENFKQVCICLWHSDDTTSVVDMPWVK